MTINKVGFQEAGLVVEDERELGFVVGADGFLFRLKREYGERKEI